MSVYWWLELFPYQPQTRKGLQLAVVQQSGQVAFLQVLPHSYTVPQLFANTL
ncbi:unnamed protein product [Periconia digitata]|uniref:Uncharacterized protein n=1 Tax=Periconia digitata TaxID=1303443 RepID=A0A9W4UJU2_9PLEO|nr:unnamed protein product [Periconia digitata]